MYQIGGLSLCQRVVHVADTMVKKDMKSRLEVVDKCLIDEGISDEVCGHELLCAP